MRCGDKIKNLIDGLACFFLLLFSRFCCAASCGWVLCHNSSFSIIELSVNTDTRPWENRDYWVKLSWRDREKDREKEIERYSVHLLGQASTDDPPLLLSSPKFLGRRKLCCSVCVCGGVWVCVCVWECVIGVYFLNIGPLHSPSLNSSPLCVRVGEFSTNFCEFCHACSFARFLKVQKHDLQKLFSLRP